MKVRKLSILWVMSTSPFILFSRRGTECAESDTIDTYFVCREAHVNVLEDAEFFSSFSVLSHKKKSFFFRRTSSNTQTFCNVAGRVLLFSAASA